jgi:hypothetical protein
MLAPPFDSSASTTAAGYRDGFGRRVLAFDREEGVTLERLYLRAELGAYEAALREASAQIALCTDERIARCRGIQRDELTGDLVMISDVVPGERIADLLDAAYDQTRDGASVPGVDVAIGFLLEVLPALAALRATTGRAHGAVGPARTVLDAGGRVVLLECGFAEVLQRLRFDRRRLWADFQIAMPPSAGPARFDATADVAQAALTAALLVTGRPLRDGDYLDVLPAMLPEVFEVAQIRGSAEFAEGLQRFLERALPLPGRNPYGTLELAYAEVQVLAGEISHDACRGALTEYVRQMGGAPIEDDFTFTSAHIELGERARAAARAVEAEADAGNAGWTEPEEEWTETAAPAEEPATAVPFVAAPPPAPVAEEPPVEAVPSPRRKRARSERRIWDTLRSIIEPARPAPAPKPEPRAAPVEPEPVEAPAPVAAAPQKSVPERFADFMEDPVPAPVAAKPRRPMSIAAAQAAAASTPLAIERFGTIEAPAAAARPTEPGPVVGRSIVEHLGFEPAAFDSAPRPAAPPPPVPFAAAAASPQVSFTPGPAAPVSWGPGAVPEAPPPSAVPPPTPPMPTFASPPTQSFAPPPMPSFGGPAVPVPGSPPPTAGAAAPAPIQVASAPPAAIKIKMKTSETVRLKADPSPASASRSAFREPAPPQPGPVVRPARKSSRGLWKYAAAAVVIIGAAIAAGRVYSPEPPSTVARAAEPKTAPTPPVADTTGTLAVDTQPSGVRVLLDGDDVGNSPLKLSGIAAGRHVVTFETTSGSVKRTVRVEAGKTTELDVPVFSGWVAIFSPIVLEITEGGVSLGSTEQSRLLLSPGRHELTLTNRQLGYTATHVVNIDPGEERRLTVEPRGTVNLNAVPWAEVWIDGTRIGETPLANHQLALGSHEIVFKHPQFGERRVPTTVTAGPPAAISIDFNQ